MNRFLADCVGALNALLAGVIIVGCAIGIPPIISQQGSVYGVGTPAPGTFLLIAVSAVVGVFVAIFVCGLLAIAIDARNTLRLILAKLEAETRPVRRSEPTLQ
jgi:hypothetical protein